MTHILYHQPISFIIFPCSPKKKVDIDWYAFFPRQIQNLWKYAYFSLCTSFWGRPLNIDRVLKPGSFFILLRNKKTVCAFCGQWVLKSQFWGLKGPPALPFPCAEQGQRLLPCLSEERKPPTLAASCQSHPASGRTFLNNSCSRVREPCSGQCLRTSGLMGNSLGPRPVGAPVRPVGEAYTQQGSEKSLNLQPLLTKLGSLWVCHS